VSSSEALFIWGAIVCYAASTVVSLILVIFQKDKWARFNLWIAAAGVAFHLAALVYRVGVTGHVPVKSDYENALTGSLFISLPAVLIAARSRKLLVLPLAVMPLVLFLLGFALVCHEPGSPLTPPYKSTWLVVHVTFAQLSYGAYSLAFGAGVCHLLKERRLRRGLDLGMLNRLPDLEDLDDVMFRFVLLGFVASALMIVAGAFWADALWGNYWSWDPVETWSLLSWIVYGLIIHLRVVHNWRGKRIAWLVVFAIIFVLISFWGVNFLASTQHDFSAL